MKATLLRLATVLLIGVALAGCAGTGGESTSASASAYEFSSPED